MTPELRLARVPQTDVFGKLLSRVLPLPTNRGRMELADGTLPRDAFEDFRVLPGRGRIAILPRFLNASGTTDKASKHFRSRHRQEASRLTTCRRVLAKTG